MICYKKLLLFQTQNEKKNNHSSTHFQFLITVLLSQEWSHLSNPQSPQINIDKDIYEKQKRKIVHCAVKMAGGCGIKMMWKFLGCIFFVCFVLDR